MLSVNKSFWPSFGYPVSFGVEAHRLSTVQQCDRVLAVGGAIAEESDSDKHG